MQEWPIERQRLALADAGFAGSIYEDSLTRHQLRGRNTAALTARDEMLRPTARQTPELILVASIRVLALSPVDLTAALAAAAARAATVKALDTGLEITPAAGAAEFAAACAAWDKARRGDQTRDARGKGHQAMMAAAERRRKEALAIARPLWGLPSDDMPAEAIAARAGLSVGSLYKYLGRRTPAQRRAKANPIQTDLENFTGPPPRKAKQKGKANV